MSSSVHHRIWNYKCFLVGHKFLDFAGNLKQKVFLQPVNSETVSLLLLGYNVPLKSLVNLKNH